MPTAFEKTLQFFFPAQCLSCTGDMPTGKTSSLCAACLTRIEWRCSYEQMPEEEMRCMCAAVFDGPVRDLIHAFKYHGKDYLAPFLAQLWLGRTVFQPDEIDVVMAVPSSYIRSWRRGYNQAALLAREVARAWDKPVVGSLLHRRLWSSSQTELGRKQRFRNASLSFRIKSLNSEVRGKSVLLLDDVCTTGATFSACASLLKAAGAERVYAGAIARELLK